MLLREPMIYSIDPSLGLTSCYVVVRYRGESLSLNQYQLLMLEEETTNKIEGRGESKGNIYLWEHKVRLVPLSPHEKQKAESKVVLKPLGPSRSVRTRHEKL